MELKLQVGIKSPKIAPEAPAPEMFGSPKILAPRILLPNKPESATKQSYKTIQRLDKTEMNLFLPIVFSTNEPINANENILKVSKVSMHKHACNKRSEIFSMKNV